MDFLIYISPFLGIVLLYTLTCVFLHVLEFFSEYLHFADLLVHRKQSAGYECDKDLHFLGIWVEIEPVPNTS